MGERVARIEINALFQMAFGIGKLSHLQQNRAQNQVRAMINRAKRNRLLKILNRLFVIFIRKTGNAEIEIIIRVVRIFCERLRPTCDGLAEITLLGIGHRLAMQVLRLGIGGRNTPLQLRLIVCDFHLQLAAVAEFALEILRDKRRGFFGDD